MRHPIPKTPIPHGTLGGYTNHSCRCAECRAANTAHNLRRRRERNALLAADDPRHGKETTYFNHACRCEPCKAANRVANRARRVKR